MPDTVGVDLCSHPLCNDIHEIILEILRDARHEGHAHRRPQKQANSSEKPPTRQLAVTGGVVIDDESHDVGIEHRKELIDRRQDQRETDEKLIALEVRKKKFHRKILLEVIRGQTPHSPNSHYRIRGMRCLTPYYFRP